MSSEGVDACWQLSDGLRAQVASIGLRIGTTAAWRLVCIRRNEPSVLSHLPCHDDSTINIVIGINIAIIITSLLGPTDGVKTVTLAIGIGVGLGIAVVLLLVVFILVIHAAKRRQRRRFTHLLT